MFKVPKDGCKKFMKVTIIKYNAGNTKSVTNALLRLGITPTISADPNIINSSDRVIFPGVGEASTAMNSLRENSLVDVIKSLKQPVLGICLGLQLMCNHSEEGNTTGLGIFDVKVKRFNFNSAEKALKVPQIGWNCAKLLNENDDDRRNWYYFVHSYYAELCNDTYLATEYGIKFSSALKKENFLAVQFHPEKSAEDGEVLLKNFLEQKY